MGDGSASVDLSLAELRHDSIGTESGKEAEALCFDTSSDSSSKFVDEIIEGNILQTRKLR